jgi:3-oxoadipate enol-lactonase
MPTCIINGVPVAYDEAGNGPPLLLIHAGVTDRRMWDDVLPSLAERHRVIRFDLQGYGDTPLPDGPFSWTDDARGLLEALDAAPADVLGISVGAGIALDLALAHPQLVHRLVLVAPGIPGWEFQPEMNAYDAAESAAVARGDLDEASWLNVRFWVDGPHRSADQVDAAVRHRVFEMQHRAFEVDNDAAELRWLVPDRGTKLAQVAASTLVVTGELDQADFPVMAARCAERIPDARLVVMPGVAHLPPMEAPGAFAKLVLGFLDGKRES